MSIAREPNILERVGIQLYKSEATVPIIKAIALISLTYAGGRESANLGPYLQNWIPNLANAREIAQIIGVQLGAFGTASALFILGHLHNPNILFSTNVNKKLYKEFVGSSFTTRKHMEAIPVGRYASFIPERYLGRSFKVGDNEVKHGDIVLRMNLRRNNSTFTQHNTDPELLYQGKPGNFAFLNDILREVESDIAKILEIGKNEGWLDKITAIVGDSHLARGHLAKQFGAIERTMGWEQRYVTGMLGMRETEKREIQLSIMARLTREGHGIGSVVIPEAGELSGRRAYVTQIFIKGNEDYVVGVSRTPNSKVVDWLSLSQFLYSSEKRKVVVKSGLDTKVISKNWHSMMADYLKWSRQAYKRISNSRQAWMFIDH